MFCIAFLLLGFVLGWLMRSFFLSRYFAWILKSSLEFGGSQDELNAYKTALEKTTNCIPKFARRLLWIRNGN
jgi:hypothetical protein